MSAFYINLVHTTFHQKQDMCMVNQYPCVVWHHSLSRHVTLWNIYNLTWNMTCVTHIWVNVKVFYNLRISSEFQLYEFAASSAECSEIPSNKYSSKWAGLESLSAGPETGLTHSPLSSLARPAQARSQWLVASGQIFTAPSHQGRGTEPALGLMDIKLQNMEPERSVQWQYLSLF